MNSDHDDLSKFQDAYLDYLEGDRDEPPVLEELPEEQRRAAKAFIDSITAARGVDPYASRPSIELLSSLSIFRTATALVISASRSKTICALTVDP